MIVNAEAVVLSRRDWGESGRLITLYTSEMGKLRARAQGVNKPGRKLKGLCEPFVRAEFRLYLSPHSEAAKIIGGQILSSFPLLRRNTGRLLAAFSLCEMLSHLTPERLPNPNKYRLIVSALRRLEEERDPWLLSAYGLRLLESAGHGVAREMLPLAARPLWSALHRMDFEQLAALPEPEEGLGQTENFVLERISAIADRELRSPKLLRRLAGGAGHQVREAAC